MRGAMTEGCSRLPTAEEIVARLGHAGFVAIERRSPIPGDGFYAFVGETAGAPASRR
jgi:hypothetical protein